MDEEELERLRMHMLMQERRLSKEIDDDSHLFALASEEGYFVKLNRTWEKALGWTRDELTSHPWLWFVHPDDRKPTQDAAIDMRDRSVLNFENRYRCKDGRYVRLRWSALQWHDGHTFAVAEILT